MSSRLPAEGRGYGCLVMNVLLIVNPRASSVTPRRQLQIFRLLAAHHDVRMVETKWRGHATDLAARAVADDIDAVVVYAGDGTLNEAANGLIGSDVVLAPLPGGSTNVFSRTLGLDDKATKAAQTVLEALAAGSVRPIGTGSVNGRHFLFHCGVGWDATLVRQTEKRARFKRLLGHGLFVWCGLETWFRLYDRTRPHFEVHHEDGRTVRNGYFTVVQNSNPYTYVGRHPFNVSPSLTLVDPLAVTTLTELRTKPFLNLMWETLRHPEAFVTHDIVDHVAKTNALTITADEPVPYQADGDDLGDATLLEFHHHPDSLQVVIPERYPW